MSSDATDHAEPNYWAVFLALLILTVAEVGLIYIKMPRVVMVVSLILFALTKAALVAAYFMHLKFERGPLILVVLSPLLLSVILYIGLVPDATTHILWLPH